jgi:hypothetical protein
MLDVSSDSVQDRTPIILWPEKDDSQLGVPSDAFHRANERIGLRKPEVSFSSCVYYNILVLVMHEQPHGAP